MAETVEFHIVASGKRVVFEAAVGDGLGALHAAVGANVRQHPEAFDLSIGGEILGKKDEDGCVGDTTITAGCEVILTPTEKAAAIAELKMTGRAVATEEGLKYAISNGADVGLVSLYLKAGVPFSRCVTPAAAAGNVDVLRFLLARGVDVEWRAHELRPLHWAACNGHAECVALLLQHGADSTAVDGQLRNALHFAAYGGAVECVRTLLAAGISPSCRTKDKKTPLHIAASRGQRACLEQLLRSPGVDVNVVCCNGKTALDCARTEECVSLLREHGGRSHA